MGLDLRILATRARPSDTPNDRRTRVLVNWRTALGECLLLLFDHTPNWLWLFDQDITKFENFARVDGEILAEPDALVGVVHR